MFGRSAILFPLILLALLAVLTMWIDRSVQKPVKKLDGSARHDPDYMLNNFTTTRTDANGNLRYVLSAEEMKHFPDDDTTKLIHPHFSQYAVDKPYTKVQSERGFVSGDGENIQFMDNVIVVRQAFKDRGEMTITTNYLNVTPKTEIVVTEQPVVIHQAPETVIYATGMVYDKKQKTVLLKSRVKAHYVRPGSLNTTPAGAAVNAATANKKNVPTETQSIVRQPSKAFTKNKARIRRTYEKPASQ